MITRKSIAAITIICILSACLTLARPNAVQPAAQQPVLGVVSTSAEDDRQEAQADMLIEAAEQGGFDVLSMPVERTQEEQIARAAAACDFNMKVCEHLKQQVDNIFHDEVCRKVFGNITPTVDAFAEFFLQLAPIVRTAQAERQEKVRKYTDKYRRGE